MWFLNTFARRTLSRYSLFYAYGRHGFRNYSELNRILEMEIKNADAVMCFGLNGYLAFRKAKRYGKPTIAFIGGCVYETLTNMDSVPKRMLAPVMMELIRDMAKNSDYVHYVADFLFDRYPTDHKYLICSDAAIEIDDRVIQKRTEKIMESKNEPKMVGIIGYTHNRIKGIDTAIRALSMLGEEYRLQIVGRGDNAWLHRIACELKIEHRIEFLGVLNGRSEIFDWLDSIDIYLQPSLTEGMPRATLEAMSRGCPVITTSVGGLKTLIDEEDRIAVGDYETLAYKLDVLGKDKDLLLSKAIRNFKEAKSYESVRLDKKRDSFYSTIVEDLRCRKTRE